MLPWRPIDETFEVQDGKWVKGTGLYIDGTQYELENSHLYRIKVWQKDNPEVMDTHVFDLEGLGFPVPPSTNAIIDNPLLFN